MFDDENAPWGETDAATVCHSCYALLLDPEDYETCAECASVLCPDCQIPGMDKSDQFVVLCAKCARQE